MAAKKRTPPPTATGALRPAPARDTIPGTHARPRTRGSREQEVTHDAAPVTPASDAPRGRSRGQG